MPAHSSTLARLVLCIAVLLLHGEALAGLQDARAAYERGDYRTAFASFRPLAEKGNLEAQTMLGWMLVQGLGVSQNPQEGRKWLERAASADGNAASAKAQHNLGVMYENGIGVPRDPRRAASWYLRGAQNGDASAQSNLGTLYLDGLGVDRDPAKGVNGV